MTARTKCSVFGHNISRYHVILVTKGEFVLFPFQGQGVRVQGRLGIFRGVVRVNRRTETVDLMRRARNLEMERDVPFDWIQLIDEDDSESGDKAGTV